MNNKLNVADIMLALIVIAICSAIVLTSLMKASKEIKVEQSLIITNPQ